MASGQGQTSDGFSKVQLLAGVRAWQVAFWVLFVAVMWSLSTYSFWIDYERRQIEISMLRLITNEASSGVAALLLVVFVKAMLDRFPLTRDRLLPNTLWHAGGSVVFSLAHVGMMMLMRELVFWLNGLDYVHAAFESSGGLPAVLMYEYSKDLPVYLGFAAIIMVYRYFAGGGSENGVAVTTTGSGINKILVKKGKADRALDLASIDWFQAASNYVRVFAGGEEYLVRSTMSEIEEKLTGQPFMRVHRSFIANLSKVEEIVPIDGGSHRLQLEGGGHIPVGRRYRDALYERLKA